MISKKCIIWRFKWICRFLFLKMPFKIVNLIGENVYDTSDKNMNVHVEWVIKDVKYKIGQKLSCKLYGQWHCISTIKFTFKMISRFLLIYDLLIDDLSYHKAATQFHTRPSYMNMYVASSAIDRNITTCMRTYSIGDNTPDKQVWWKVDLGAVYSIYSITILFKNYNGYGMYLYIQITIDIAKTMKKCT